MNGPSGPRQPPEEYSNCSNNNNPAAVTASCMAWDQDHIRHERGGRGGRISPSYALRYYYDADAVLTGGHERSRQRSLGGDDHRDKIDGDGDQKPPPAPHSHDKTNKQDQDTNKKGHHQGGSQQDQEQPPHRQVYVEIAPGLTARLRGALETWHCIERDFYLPTMCLDCTMDLFCIQDASHVLCPTCRVISPMEGLVLGYDGGIGMGFTVAQLQAWQCDIVRKQREAGWVGKGRRNNRRGGGGRWEEDPQQQDPQGGIRRLA